MKKTLRIIVSLTLCAAILSLSLLSAFAEEEKGLVEDWNWLNENDLVRIRDFFSQTDENGVTNGDKALEFTHLLPTWSPTYYDPDNLVSIFAAGGVGYFDVDNIEGLMYIDVFRFLFFEIISLFRVEPDFHGVLDLSNTSIHELNGDSFITHITEVNLNDCENLTHITLFDNPVCTELHALNTTLEWVSIGRNDLRVIELQLKRANEPIIVKALGKGRLEFVYSDIECDGTTYSVTAISRTGRFLGWYSDGQCVGTSTVYIGQADEGANLTAVFAGDVDGDGTLTMADAVTILRSSMGIADCPLTMGDIDGSGDVSIMDALTLLRFVMGV